MNIQKFTQKSIEALQNAQTLASTNQNVQVEQEHILLALLEQDNSLIKELIKKITSNEENFENEVKRLKQTIVKPTDKVNELLESKGTSILTTGTKMAELLKRTELTYDDLEVIDENRPNLSIQEKEEVEIQIKYEGYIKLQEEQVEKFKKLESKKLSEDIDYEKINGISLEARQKLNKFKPTSIGQASRISGVSPADISVLLIYDQMNKNKKEG